MPAAAVHSGLGPFTSVINPDSLKGISAGLSDSGYSSDGVFLMFLLVPLRRQHKLLRLHLCNDSSAAVCIFFLSSFEIWLKLTFSLF